MLLSQSVFDQSTTECAKCHKPTGSIGTVVNDKNGPRNLIFICEPCLFIAVIGKEEFNRLANLPSEKPAAPEPEPNVEPLKPRWFGWGNR